MLQDIEPKFLNNQYHSCELTDGASICCFSGKKILSSVQNGQVSLPRFEALREGLRRAHYLFSIDDVPYFLGELEEDFPLPEGYGYDEMRSHRALAPRDRVYAEMTAYHLYVWYRDNAFCGRCGHRTQHDEKLRMLYCPNCQNMIFPKICPAVIVGVVDGDRILLTKYAGRAYKNYALIAGFIEIGETAEQAVAREVFEETGVHVKDIRYWATQPWGIESDLLLGYFATLDGSKEIHMDRDELSLAGWYDRREMELPSDSASLTNDMIRAFIENRHPQ